MIELLKLVLTRPWAFRLRMLDDHLSNIQAHPDLRGWQRFIVEFL